MASPRRWCGSGEQHLEAGVGQRRCGDPCDGARTTGRGRYNTDYWQVTDRNGTVYQFGRNQLPGWASGKPTDQLGGFGAGVLGALAGPVLQRGRVHQLGVHDGVPVEPGLCQGRPRQRDVVLVQPGHELLRRGQRRAQRVVRAGQSTSTHIDYGFTDGGAYGTVPNKVVFATGDRCFTAPCSPLNATTQGQLAGRAVRPGLRLGRDVHLDRAVVLLHGAADLDHHPAVLDRVVDVRECGSYGLTEMLPSNTGDGLSPTLWLQSITHTGSDTTARWWVRCADHAAAGDVHRDVPDGQPGGHGHRRAAGVWTGSGSVR